MPTMHPSGEPIVPDKISSQESPLSPEWTDANTTLMGHPLSLTENDAKSLSRLLSWLL